MVQKDRLTDVVTKSIGDYMRTGVPLNLLGRRFKARPYFISVYVGASDESKVKIVDGGLVGRIGMTTHDSGFRAFALFGDGKNGYGEAISSREGISLEPGPLEGGLRDGIDTAVKVAARKFLSALGENLMTITADNNGLVRLPGDNIETFTGEDVSFDPIPKRMIEMLRRWSARLTKRDYVSNSEAGVYFNARHTWFADSQGRLIIDSLSQRRVSLEVTINQEDGTQLIYTARILSSGRLNGYQKELRYLMRDTDEWIRQLRTAKSLPSGQYPVVFSSDAAGVLFHEGIAAHLLSGKYIMRHDTSAFSGKLGEKVLPEFITLIDDPTYPGFVGTYRYDDEGIRAQRVVLVENGVIRNYLLDRVSAAHFKTHSNGHARSEWVVDKDEDPVYTEPRIGNLVVQSSRTSKRSLISRLREYCTRHGLEFGIYLDCSAGDVTVGSGEFRLNPHRAWKIYPDGRREAVTNILLTGNPYELLTQIAAVGNKPAINGGFCGAESGFVPTSCIAPEIFIPKVTLEQVKPQRYTPSLLSQS